MNSEGSTKSFERVCGVLIAVFAAVLGIMNGLGVTGIAVSIYAFHLAGQVP